MAELCLSQMRWCGRASFSHLKLRSSGACCNVWLALKSGCDNGCAVQPLNTCVLHHHPHSGGTVIRGVLHGTHVCCSKAAAAVLTAATRAAAVLPLLLLLLQERPYPRRPADMPTFPTADTPGSTHRQQPAARHDEAVQQHVAEVVDAAYAAAGLPRPRRDSDSDRHQAAAAAAGYGTQHIDADELPGTLYQRYDTAREGREPPAAKRPRPSGGL